MATLFSVIAAVTIPIAQFAILFPMTSEMPSWDQWSEVEVLRAHFEHRSVLPLLLAPYNGHFNVVPRCVFYAMGLLTHWNVRVEVVASYVVCAATVALLMAMLHETNPGLLVLAAPVAAYMFSVVQFENFLSGYPLGQHLSVFASVLSLRCLTRRDPMNNRLWLAVLAALVASFSFGAANCVWIVGLFAIATDVEPRRGRLVVWVAATVPCVLLARVAAQSADLAVDWRELVPCFFVLLGKPYSPIAGTSVWLAAGLGLGVFVFFCLLVFLTLRRNCVDGSSIRRWVGLALLGLGAAALIAFARPNTGQALASHYASSTVLLGIATLVVFSTWVGRGAEVQGLRRFAICVAATLALLQTATASASWIPILRRWAATHERNVGALMLGTATDRQIEQSIYPVPELVRDSLPFLRQHRLAIFRHLPGNCRHG